MLFDVRQSCGELLTAARVREESHVSLLCAGWSVRRKDGRQKSWGVGRWNHSSEGGSWLLTPKTDPFPSLSPGWVLSSRIFQKWWVCTPPGKSRGIVSSLRHSQKPCRPSGILFVQHPVCILLLPWRMPWTQILAWYLFPSRKRGQRDTGWSGETGGHIGKRWI